MTITHTIFKVTPQQAASESKHQTKSTIMSSPTKDDYEKFEGDAVHEKYDLFDPIKSKNRADWIHMKYAVPKGRMAAITFQVQ